MFDDFILSYNSKCFDLSKMLNIIINVHIRKSKLLSSENDDDFRIFAMKYTILILTEEQQPSTSE